MTVLEDMMPMDYLARFVSVSSSRRQLYNKVFVRFRSLKDSMLNEEVCKNRWSCHYIWIGYIIDTPNCLLTIFRLRYLLWSWWWALPLTPIFKINYGRLWVSFSRHMSQSSSITRLFYFTQYVNVKLLTIPFHTASIASMKEFAGIAAMFERLYCQEFISKKCDQPHQSKSEIVSLNISNQKYL